MQIVLNGESQTVTATTVAELIAALDLTGKRVAVELNGEIAPRSQHAGIALKDGDKVEVVHAIGGG